MLRWLFAGSVSATGVAVMRLCAALWTSAAIVSPVESQARSGRSPGLRTYARSGARCVPSLSAVRDLIDCQVSDVIVKSAQWNDCVVPGCSHTPAVCYVRRAVRTLLRLQRAAAAYVSPLQVPHPEQQPADRHPSPRTQRSQVSLVSRTPSRRRCSSVRASFNVSFSCSPCRRRSSSLTYSCQGLVC